jgi:hypothetical protein
MRRSVQELAEELYRRLRERSKERVPGEGHGLWEEELKPMEP